MPLLQVKLIEGVFSTEQKRQMIEKLTETMVSIEGEKMARRHLHHRRRGEER